MRSGRQWYPDQYGSSRRHQHADLDEDTSIHWQQRADRSQRVARAGVPLGRAGQAQDIANGVLFLASDTSNYMTGAELVIDGGMMAALGLGGAETYRPGVSSTVSAKCEFSGKFHMNISMGDSAKVASTAVPECH